MNTAEATSRAIFGITTAVMPRDQRAPLRHARSRYEAAETDSGNERHWANSDGLSGRAANSPEVRRKLRERARLEFDNGGNCKGPIETIAHDMIGTGARLQLKPPPDVSEEAARAIAKRFQDDWCDDPIVDFADKLRIMVESELRDGESFALFANNPGIESRVQLDVRVIDAEQCASPSLLSPDKNRIDGIDFDTHNNPITYHILKDHPGDTFSWTASEETRPWPADKVAHWFRGSRASHARGVPRITAGLGIHAHIRNFTRSVLGAARIAAMFAGILKTNMAPDGGPVSVEAYDVVPFDHDGLLTAPAGWEPYQMKAEQPVSTYKDFRETVLTEFGRGIHAPRNIVTGDSSPYNYSSSRLDHIIYRGAIKVARNRLAIRVLDRVFKLWFAEAILIRDYIPDADSLPPLSEWTWTWRYDAFPSIDPVKDATATETLLRNGLLTMKDALNDLGVDLYEHVRQMERERKLFNSVGLEHPYWLQQKIALSKSQPATPERKPASDGSDETVLDDEEAAYAH